MNRTGIHAVAAVGVAAVLALGASAQAQTPAPAGAAVTKSLQGGDNHAWTDNPYMHAFYNAVVAAVGKDARKTDVPALEVTSAKIFGEFGVSMGMTPKAMQDHLKLIPGQIVKIAQEDPHVLDSYDSFTEALMGPK